MKNLTATPNGLFATVSCKQKLKGHELKSSLTLGTVDSLEGNIYKIKAYSN